MNKADLNTRLRRYNRGRWPYERSKDLSEVRKKLFTYNKVSRVPHISKAVFSYPVDSDGMLFESMAQYHKVRNKPEGKVYTSRVSGVTSKRDKAKHRKGVKGIHKLKRNTIESKHPRKDKTGWRFIPKRMLDKDYKADKPVKAPRQLAHEAGKFEKGKRVLRHKGGDRKRK